MEIKRYESSLLSSNMNLIAEEMHAIVIDLYQDVRTAKDLRIDKIILPLEHYDHIFGVNDRKAKTNAPVICSK